MTKYGVALLVAACTIGTAHAAKHMASRPCDALLANCKARNVGKQAGCQMLFDAAVKSGGTWGQPETRAAAHIPGGLAVCNPN